MVTIDDDDIILDFGNSDDDGLTIRTLCMKLHTDLDIVRTFEHLFRHFLDALSLFVAITFFGGDLDRQFVAGRFPGQRVFMTGREAEQWNSALRGDYKLQG